MHYLSDLLSIGPVLCHFEVDSEIVERGMAIPETRHIEVKKKLPVARVRNQKRKREGPPPLEPAKRSAIESTHGPTAIPAKPVLKAKKLPEERILSSMNHYFF